jgi:hypothetical protein
VSFLIPTMGAVLVPSVAVPLQVPVPLAEVTTGPADANCVFGSAATAGTESPGDATQSSLSAGASLDDALVVHDALLPAPATIVIFAADAGMAVSAIIPPAAKLATSEVLMTVLIIEYPPLSTVNALLTPLPLDANTHQLWAPMNRHTGRA